MTFIQSPTKQQTLSRLIICFHSSYFGHVTYIAYSTYGKVCCLVGSQPAAQKITAVRAAQHNKGLLLLGLWFKPRIYFIQKWILVQKCSRIIFKNAIFVGKAKVQQVCPTNFKIPGLRSQSMFCHILLQIFFYDNCKSFFHTKVLLIDEYT